jgi:UDP-N-acetylglucosamine 1-carboxyvinyltransferase
MTPTDTLYITGGRPLEGILTVGGSKNGSLPVLAASLLLSGTSRLTNIPQIEDVEIMLDLLRCCGVTIERDAAGAIVVQSDSLCDTHVPGELAAKMRASYYLVGPLAARIGHASVPLPGGCNLGSRPVDYALQALEPIGIVTEIQDDCIVAVREHAHGGRVVLNPTYRSPGATFLVIMTACIGDGETVIQNACYEPDVVNLCEFLTRAGASISGAGTPTIAIKGVKELHGVEHLVLGDRLEAGTYLLAGAASRGDVTTRGLSVGELRGFAETLLAAGVEVLPQPDGVRVRCQDRPHAIDIVAEPFPGFPTDLQPPMMSLLATADGISHVEERIFDGRMGHVDELRRMGACMEATERHAIITGVAGLRGAAVQALNIRAGAALLVAAASAYGETAITGLHHLARGYERVEEKLLSLGAELRLGSGAASDPSNRAG